MSFKEAYTNADINQYVLNRKKDDKISQETASELQSLSSYDFNHLLTKEYAIFVGNIGILSLSKNEKNILM